MVAVLPVEGAGVIGRLARRGTEEYRGVRRGRATKHGGQWHRELLSEFLTGTLVECNSQL